MALNAVNHRRAILVIDLAYGDCGKGTIVDYLVRQAHADLVVRFNGGPQAGHNVVLADGRHHTFSQFGSGTFVDGVRTVLSHHVLIEPYALFNEEAHLREIGIFDALGRLHIDSHCPVITPIHLAAGRLRDCARGAAAHGTCGMGVGEVMQDLRDHPEAVFFAGDLSDRGRVRSCLLELQAMKVDQLAGALREFESHPRLRFEVQTLRDPSWMDAAMGIYVRLSDRVGGCDELLRSSESIVFEGAQGVLLDETHGFHPHTTWSTTTFRNAEQLLHESHFSDQPTRIGVLRSYFTRHGPGPLITEDADLSGCLPEPHNTHAGWQGAFRVGVFDAAAARYALAVVGGVDVLAITHLDRLDLLPQRICDGYLDELHQPFPLSPDSAGSQDKMEQFTRRLLRCRPVYRPMNDPMPSEGFTHRLAEMLQTPVGIRSFGPTAGDKTKSAALSKHKI